MPLLTLALLCLGAAPAPQLQPRTYLSPSGGWSLRVEPLTRKGTGGADYTMTGGGREAWKQRHPFVLWDAAVTDDGRVGGYGYAGPFVGSLHVVVLSPQGEVLLQEENERRFLGPDSQAVPLALGLFLQPELDRFVVRVDGGDSPSAECWWAYDLAAGKELFRECPKDMLGLEGAIGRASAVKPVPGTPLVLVNWFRHDIRVQPSATGALFQLLDAERRPVWRLDLTHDYELRGDKAAQRLLQDQARQHGAILDIGPKRFELHHVAEKQRVTYNVAEDTAGGWKVTEVARAPLDGKPNQNEVALYKPKLLHEVTLGSSPPPSAASPTVQTTPPAGIDALYRGTIDSTSGLVLLQDLNTKAIHVFERDGREVRVCRPRDEDVAGLHCTRMNAVSDGTLWASDHDTYRHVRFDSEGVSRGIEILGAQNTVFLPDSGAYWGVKGRLEPTLVRIGSGGRRELEYERVADGRWWRSISDLALAADGRIAVLDVSNSFGPAPGAPLVALFDEDGAPSKHFDLPEDLHPRRISYAGPWVLLASWKTEIWLLDTRDGSVGAVDLGAQVHWKAAKALGLAPDASELWVLEAENRRLLRFSMPD